MSTIVVGILGTQTITTSETDTVTFLGLGTLNITGTSGAPIDVTLSQVGGVGLLDTINITNANVTQTGVAGVAALVAYNLGAGARLTLASTIGVTAGSTITFTAPNSRLVLGAGVDVSLFSGIAGFGPGNSIDVSPLAATATYADAPGSNTGGTLTLRNAGGAVVGTVPLSTGDYSTGSFAITPDGTGGTLITFAATVTGITATPATASLGVDQAVTFTLPVSNAVTVAGGTPTLTLNDGGIATYVAGSSTPTSLVFTTTVAAGQNTADLAVTAINLNGASVLDSAGGAANLSAAVANPAGILQIDTLAPTITGVTTSPGSGSLGVGQVVTLTVTSSEAVTILGGTPTLTLNDGGIATYVAGSSTPTSLVFTTTIAAGQNAADLAVTAANPNGATIADAAGNLASLAGAVINPAGVLAIDTLAPTITAVTTSPGSGSLGVGQVVTLTVTPSEAVIITGGPPTLTLNDGGIATYVPGSSTPTSLVFTTTVAAGQNVADLAVTASNLNGATIADAAGNLASLAGAITNPAGILAIDTLAPAITGVTTSPGSGSLSAGQVVAFTVTPSEAVTVTGGIPTLTLNDGGIATYVPGSSTPTALVFTTIVAAGQNVADLAVTASNLNGATIADAAGNLASLAGAVTNPAGILAIDTTAPTITGVTTSPGSGAIGPGQVVTLTITPSEAVTVVGGTPTLSLSTGGIATYVPGSSTPTGMVFTTTIAPGQAASDLAVTAINTNGATIADAAGNAADLSGAVTNPPGVLTIDTTAPTFTTVTTAPGSGSLGAGQLVTLTVTSSEAVTIAGGTPTLTLNDGGIATYVAGSSTPTSLVFTTTVAAGQNTPDLAVTAANLNGATIADAAGNLASLVGAVINPAGILAIDTLAPTITGVTTSPGSGALGAGQVVTLTVTPSEAVTVIGGTPTLTLNDGGTATYVPGSSTPTSLVFTTTVAPGQNVADLAVTATNLNGATIADAAGNLASLAGAITNPAGILAIDTLAPTVTGVATTPASGTIGLGTPVGITVTTSEPVIVTGGPPTLSLGNGGTATYVPGSSIPGSLVFTYTPTAGQNTPDLTITAVNLNGGTIADAAGNAANLSGAVGNPPGVLAIDATYHPFLTLLASNTDPAAVMTVTAQTRPAITGTFGRLGTGSIGPDGSTYTVTGTAAQVNAALAAVTLVPAPGSPTATGLTGTVSDPSGGTGTLSDTSSQASVLVVYTAGDVLRAGTGADTVIALAGGTTLIGGPGRDVLVGSTGGSTVQGGTGSSILFGMGGNTVLYGGGAQDIFSVSAGNTTIASAVGGRAVIGLGSGPSLVNTQGADTLIGGSGDLTAGLATGSVGFLGSGRSVVSAATGTTVVGGAGPDTVGVRGSDILFFAGSGPALFIGGTGASTVTGGAGGTAVILGGEGGGIFNGGSGGSNYIVGGMRPTTIYGGGDNDLLFARGAAGTVIKAASGNETIQGIASSGTDTFFTGTGNTTVGIGSGTTSVFFGTGNSTVVGGGGFNVFAATNGGSGGSETIYGFKLGTDVLGLIGYNGNEQARVAASATSTSVGGAPSTTVTLSDNTRITFAGLSAFDQRVFG